MRNILINGRACSGKDEVARYLVEEYGYTQVTFAEPIYHICRKYFRMKKKNRKLLQFVGQLLRFFNKDIWVKQALKKVSKLNIEGKHIVISDCRQMNEYIEAIKFGFIPIRVTADLKVRINRAIHRDGQYPDHTLWEGKAETGADNFTYLEVNNNDDLKNLYNQIDRIIKMEMGN
ncbi:MAG: AAA family ATPase [Bacillota bacterium]